MNKKLRSKRPTVNESRNSLSLNQFFLPGNKKSNKEEIFLQAIFFSKKYAKSGFKYFNIAIFLHLNSATAGLRNSDNDITLNITHNTARQGQSR
jgi:hypothetical protein